MSSSSLKSEVNTKPKSFTLLTQSIEFPLQGLEYGTEYGTVRLSFGKKYGTELRTVFCGKLRYGTKIQYGIIFSVPYRTLSVHKVLKTQSLVLI